MSRKHWTNKIPQSLKRPEYKPSEFATPYEASLEMSLRDAYFEWIRLKEQTSADFTALGLPGLFRLMSAYADGLHFAGSLEAEKVVRSLVDSIKEHFSSSNSVED